jgi:hypothetical protein
MRIPPYIDGPYRAHHRRRLLIQRALGAALWAVSLTLLLAVLFSPRIFALFLPAN